MAFASYQGPDFSFEVLLPESGPLERQLADWARKSRAAGRVPCVYLSAVWCPPSVKLEKSLGEPQMQRAFSKVAAATFDVDKWGETLDKAGFSRGVVPVFFVIDGEGRPTGQTITGGAWGENTPENMGPPLERFFAPLTAAIPAPAPTQGQAGPSGRAVAMAIAAALLLGIGVWLRIRQDEQARTDEQNERIRQEVQRSIQESLRKQREQK